MNRTAWLSAVALSASLCTGAFAQVTGTAKLDGKAPKRGPVAGLSANAQCAALHKQPLLDESIVADDEGNLNNVVVFLRGANVKGEAPKEEVKIDQVACQYVPHVITATIGQKIVALNSDPFLHNVHTLPEESVPTNIAMPTIDKEKGVALKPITTPEIVKTKCDVHPWMSAWIAVFDHPFHTVTGEDGAFELDVKGLKDGEYEIVAWQEKFKESEPQKISIKGGKAEKPVAFVFKQKAADAGKKGLPESEVTLTSLKAGAPAAAEGKACDACEGAKDATAKAKAPEAPAAAAAAK